MASDATTHADIVIDARGSFCPGPLMELVRHIRRASVGQVLEVRSTDAGSRRDIPAWCQKAGHTLVGIEDREGYTAILVRKER